MRHFVSLTRRERTEQLKTEAHRRAEQLRVERASAAIRAAFDHRRAVAEGKVRPLGELPDVWDGRFE